ncbi:PIN-like domain-containing protein [Verrucomicrobiota bacterium sgz303538]
MKEEFPGHFRPSKEDFESLWRSALIMLDASVLLNFYRYSAETRKEFIRVLRTFQDRLWLPHRAAEEFFRNRVSVIAQQEKTYEEAAKALEKIEKDFQNRRQHPFINNDLLERLVQVHKEVRDELNASRESHRKLITDDSILSELDELFRGRIGPSIDPADVDRICAEGKQRYEKKIPPGYKDASKDEGEEPTRRYGDLILWKQVLEKAKTDKRSIMLLLDDRKEDWWLIHEGKTVGPRPELVKELRVYTNQHGYMYQPDSFLSYAAKYANQEVSVPAITELRELRQDRENERIRSEHKRHSSEIASVGEMLLARRRELFDRLTRNAETVNFLLAHKSFLSRFVDEDQESVTPSRRQELAEVREKLAEMMAERDELMTQNVEIDVEIHDFARKYGSAPE